MLRRQRNLPIARTSMRLTAPAGYGPTARPRAGLTLVEMMVAVVMLAVGLLGLVGTAGVVTRQIGGGTRQGLAAQAIANRIERLRAMDCAQIQSGTATTRGVYESWVRGTKVNRVLYVVDTVKYTVSRSAKTQIFTITVPCR